ncbi:MAG: hypothetical protein JWM57_1182, partial [Phycisphaerales bacterium]|nr:hypothetical protein [Phycisphaerales bacterium]
MVTALFRQFLIPSPRLRNGFALAMIGTCALHAQAPAGSPLKTLGSSQPPSEAAASGEEVATIKVNFPNTPIMGII